MRTNKYEGDRSKPKVVDRSSSATMIKRERQDEMIDVMQSNGDERKVKLARQPEEKEDKKQAQNKITTILRRGEEEEHNLNETEDDKNKEQVLASTGEGQDEGVKRQPGRENVATVDLKAIDGEQAHVATVENQEDYQIQSQDVQKSWNIAEIFSNSNIYALIQVVFIVVLSCIASLALHLWNDTNVLKNKAAHVEKFNTSLNKMKNAFPGQTERFWKILRNRGNAYLKNPSPKRPLVIMIAASPSAHNVLDCMALKIAYSLEREDDVTNNINGADFIEYSDFDDAKKNLDENLNQHLQKSRTLIVLNLDLVPPQSPLLFYDYCDNENAPYKEAVIVFTIRLKVEPSPSLTPAKAEGLVEKHLKEIWRNHGYRPDDINPLVSRVTDTILLVNQESEEVINTNCAA